MFLFKKIQVGLLASVLAVVVIGFNPYFTNLIRFHDPFYMPTDKTELVQVNIPGNYFDLTPVERLLFSVFSKSDNAKGVGTEGELKWPFTYEAWELKEFTNPDTNVGGFGPLFGGIILLSLLGIVALVASSAYSREQKQALYFLLLTVFISCLLIPPASYARYVPQFWLFPVIVCLYALAGRRIFLVLIGAALLVFLVINNALISREYLQFNFETSTQLRENLHQLKQQSEIKPLEVSFGVFRQNKIRFAEAGIQFEEYFELPCEAARQKRVLIVEIPESVIQICK